MERHLLHFGVFLDRLARLAWRDRAWLVRVRKRDDDPFGPDCFVEVCAYRADVPDAMERLADQVRQGAISAP